MTRAYKRRVHTDTHTQKRAAQRQAEVGVTQLPTRKTKN